MPELLHSAEPPVLSVIVPMLNEALGLPRLLVQLQDLCAACSLPVEILFVDGGSSDGSVELVAGSSFILLRSERGRACQMNAGANAARAEKLLFLHADTELPNLPDNGVFELLIKTLDNAIWGRFDVCISGEAWMFKCIAWFMNGRSRLTGIATGDQAIFVRRADFLRVGGFSNQPLMEDVSLSSRLCAEQPPVCLRIKVMTSGRRWQQRGIWPTIFLMWRLRFDYWRGVPAEKLAKRYE
jgi:rSAM/selenodomain-associated transferase 2